MHPNEELIQKFYSAFQKLDGATMADCYTDDATFGDPAFPDLKGWRIGAMWKMLAERAQNFSLTFSDVHADDASGGAKWIASYDFSKTGRRIENHITASFEFKNGKIQKHRDSFNFWRWARMALGPTGLFLGWLPSVKAKVQKEAGTGLEMYIKRKRLGPPA
ncbi:MAG: nuclear transport factor 2 family protein [Leptospirales bacterium]|nr:nuclear transport factor 2 family protein [Leptospirales bacterium]